MAQSIAEPATYSRDKARRPPPPRRRLQIFAVDPGASNQLETAFINKTIIDVPWEGDGTGTNGLRPGPVGEYVEVVDVDPASKMAYPPVNLDDPFLLAACGLAPSEGYPQFHQQMAYAVCMRTIEAFESALGRRALWASKRIEEQDPSTGKRKKKYSESYVQRLRVYPHALRQANAYYSPDKVALLFGYFPELRPGEDDETLGGIVFTCLSHDIVAHETTHALLDGLHRRYQEASNVDVLAFHEGFADIVAMFQHFTFPELLRFQIARTRGDLQKGEFMADLARQFGQALNRSRALRSAIGVDPATTNYATTTEPHERGSILVAAVFSAFLKIYERRTQDLLRLATGGSGVLRPGAIHPDLVERLAREATKSARDVLEICIRALDYCPPVDITFPDYLRALITADADLVPVDRFGYRVAFLEAFGGWGIYPDEVRTLSVESLHWTSPDTQPEGLGAFLRNSQRVPRRNNNKTFDWRRHLDRKQAYKSGRLNAALLHDWLADPDNLRPKLADELGLNRSEYRDSRTEGFRLDETGRPVFEVHSVRPSHRVAPDDDIKREIVAVITQRRKVPLDPNYPEGKKFYFRGGCTLIIDPESDAEPIRYSIKRSIMNERRLKSQREFLETSAGLSLRALYFDSDSQPKEPFAVLHVAD